MKKLLLAALGIGIAVAIERRANTLGTTPKAVVLGAFGAWLNRLRGRSSA